MYSYVKKPLSIKKNDLYRRKDFCKYSLCPKDYRDLISVNTNVKVFEGLIKEKIRGKEIGSDSYMKRSIFRFLKTVNITKSFIINENSIEYCRKVNGVNPKNNDIFIVKDGAGDGLGEVCLYKLNNENKTDLISAGILGARVEFQYLYYILGILKSKYFKSFIDLNTAQGSTIRHSKEEAYNFEIPFPTTKHNKNIEDIESFVSFLTQNIIDKEEQIKLKTKTINEEIETELNKNQKTDTKNFEYPKLTELKDKKRLDTGLFTSKYKNAIQSIIDYKNSFKFLREFEYSWTSGSTPKTYILSDSPSDNLWIAVADIDYGLTYNKLNFIKLKNHKIGLLKNGDILITRKGATVGKMNMFFTDYVSNAFVNEDIKVLHLNHLTLEEKIFCGLFLNSRYGQTQLLSNGSKGTKQGLTNENILNVKIPSFKKDKQIKLSKYYYNQVSNESLTLDNYLEVNKLRNEKLGVFQLNMEIFDLRKKLEELVYKIVMNKEIDINKYL